MSLKMSLHVCWYFSTFLTSRRMSQFDAVVTVAGWPEGREPSYIQTACPAVLLM